MINKISRLIVNKSNEWHARGVYRLVYKMVLLTVPVLIFLGYIEYRLSYVVVSYSQKKHEIESQLNKVQVIVLGSSNAYYGVNPHFFSYNGFNFAYRAQWPYYDLKLMEKYINSMPNLKLVVVPLVYFTLGTRFMDAIDHWRLYFYAQYYHILPKDDATIIGYHHPLDPRSISKIALFGERTRYYLQHDVTNINEGEPGEDMTGWFNAGTAPCDLSLKIGESGSFAHNLSVNVRNYKNNMKYYEKLITLLRSRGVNLVFIELPQLPEYRDNINADKYALMEKEIKNISNKYHVSHFNYLKDNRFSVADFTDMPDHLNARGAEKFSKILDREVIVPLMEASLSN